MEHDTDSTGDYPRRLSLTDTDYGYVIDADGTRTHLAIAPAWMLMRRLAHPALAIEQGGIANRAALADVI